MRNLIEFSKLITKSLIAIIVLVALVIIGAWSYLTVSGYDPLTVSSAYVQTVTDIDGEESFVMEINNYSSDNGTGVEMFEFAFNSYTGIDLTAVKTYGVQIMFDGDNEPEFYYYEKVDSISYLAINELNWGDPLIVSIDDEVFSFALTGTYTETKTEFAGVIAAAGRYVSTFARSLFTGNFRELSMNLAFDTVTYTTAYTYEDFYLDARRALTTTSEGYGDYVLPLVDLANYFSIQKYNTETYQFEPIASDNTYSFNYFGVQVHNDRYGAVHANQSMFGMLEENYAYNAGVIAGETDYWAERYGYTLSNNSFVTRNSDYLGGVVLSISEDEIKQLINTPNVYLIVEINLDTLNAVGFDYAAFSNLEVDELIITSASYKTFNINDNYNFMNITTTNVEVV